MILAQNSVKTQASIQPRCESLLQEKVFEYCMTKFKIEQNYITLICIYRSPIRCNEHNFLERLELLLNCLLKNNSNIIIVGDFNINVLVRDVSYTNFVNVLTAFNLKYLVDFQTRITTTTSTAIDNCISNIPNLVTTGIITELSDHDPQNTEIKKNTEKNNGKLQTAN
ncbi:hypothetical protein J6590_042570 [Homalodisca vitripennis]|nr:hypothetical protein J6590_042570 [Homalodisca vitripennis]